MLQGKSIGSGVGPHWPLSLWPAAWRPLTLRSGVVMEWCLKVDLQLLCPGMARRLAITPLLEHLRHTCGITHQYNCHREHQLHSSRSQHGREWALHCGWLGMFPHCGHQRPPHRLTSSGVTTGWMPWVFQ